MRQKFLYPEKVSATWSKTTAKFLNVIIITDVFLSTYSEESTEKSDLKCEFRFLLKTV